MDPGVGIFPLGMGDVDSLPIALWLGLLEEFFTSPTQGDKMDSLRIELR